MKSLLYSVELCQAVYRDNPGLVHPDIIGVIEIRDPDTGADGFVFVSRRTRTLHVVFRGSESVVTRAGRLDWLNNLMVRKTDFEGIKCHRGVVRCTNAVLPRLLTILDAYPGWSITLQGHSAGGNIATLIAVALCRKYRDVPGQQLRLITFGQSRVSTREALASVLWCDYVRVQNGSDAVCRWPKLGFSHFGDNVYFPNKHKLGEFLVNPAEDVQARDIRFTTLGRVVDHKIKDYWRRCLRAASVAAK